MADQVMSRWDSETELPGGAPGQEMLPGVHLKAEAGWRHSNQQPQTRATWQQTLQCWANSNSVQK